MNILKEKKDKDLNRLAGNRIKLVENDGYFQVLFSPALLSSRSHKCWTYKKIENAEKRFEKESRYFI